MKSTIYLFTFLCFLNLVLFASDDKIKSQAENPQEIIGPDSDPTLKGVKPDLIVEFRNSGVGTICKPRLIGINIGFRVHARNRFGIGFSTLMYTAIKEVGLTSLGEVIDHDSKGILDEVAAVNAERNLFFYYANFIYSHAWIQNQVIEFQTPLEIGFGKYSVEFKKNALNPHSPVVEQQIASQNIKSEIDFLLRNGTFVPICVSATLSLKLHTIVWPYANIGYRFVVGAPEFSNDFNGLFYNFGVSIDIFGIGKGFLGLFSKKT